MEFVVELTFFCYLGSLYFPDAYSTQVNLFDLFYYTVITFGTVGYGDIIPTTIYTKLMAMVTTITSIACIGIMLTIPLWFLVPAIAAVSAVGVYAVHSTTFDLVLMVLLGVLGYILRKMHFPMSPLILGFVLGEMLEQNLRRALSISNGNLSILWDSSVAKVLLAMAIMVIVVPPVLRLLRRRQRKPQPEGG